MTYRDALLAAIRGRALEEPVTVPAGWMQPLLASSPAPGAPVDLTGARVDELLGRDPGTVASWCRSGLLVGAYRLRGREWRVPVAALAPRIDLFSGPRLLPLELFPVRHPVTSETTMNHATSAPIRHAGGR